MNLNKYLLIGTLSVIATNALAEGQNIMTSKSYVDAQDALKQDNIPARATKINNSDATFAPSVVTNTTTAGSVGQMGILTYEYADGLGIGDFDDRDDLIPTAKLIAQDINDIWNNKQDLIPTENANLFYDQQNVTGKRSVLAPTDTAGVVNQIGLWDVDEEEGWYLLHNNQQASIIRQSIPTVGSVEAMFGGLLHSISDKQDTITVGLVEFNNNDDLMLRSIVTSNAAGTALNGNTIGILDYPTIADDEGNLMSYSDSVYSNGAAAQFDNFVPTVRAVANNLRYILNGLEDRQYKIPKSGYAFFGGASSNAYNTNAASDGKSWLNANVAGTGLVTRTATDGVVGERKIFEASDLSGYSALTGNNKLIADISIPTVGAMMSAISSGATAALPTGTTGTVVTYNGTTNGVQQFTETAIASAATHNPQTGALTNGSDIANVTLVETKQNKKVCAGWPDGTTTPDSTHTDANCWLWEFPE